jgi:2',3'-cyclic-nucleotide 2'-phosphodiesterase (5'-nucleotidase family)
MRKILSLALFAIAITTTVSAWGADNSLGTWKANVAKCKYTPAPWPVKSLIVTREAAPGGVKVTNTGMRTDGSAINASYTATFDGSSSAVTGQGSPYDSISIKQGDANTFTYEAKNSKTKYRASGRIVISADGKTMTATASGVDADGKPMTLKLVYDKQ